MNKSVLPWTDWYAKARNINNPDELAEFARYLFCKQEHTYDSAVHAVSALAIAGAWFGSRIEGITSFQASYVKFDFIREFNHIGTRVGLKVVDYDDLIYPQHTDDFIGVKIKERIWRSLQQACKRELSNHDSGCWAVREWWKDVCNGVIPDDIIVVSDNTDERIYSFEPIAVECPAHTFAHIDSAWKDQSSPYFDEHKYNKYVEEWRLSHGQLLAGM